MKRLGNLLKNHIYECGYTIYKVAFLTGINRTTLQKFLSGDRRITKDALNRLIAVLNLSSPEQKELLDLYETIQMGETACFQHISIKTMLENLFSDKQTYSDMNSLSERSGFDSLIHTIASATENGTPRKLFLHIPGNSGLFKKTMHFLQNSVSAPCSVYHITPLLKSSAESHENIDTITSMLPYFFNKSHTYTARLYCRAESASASVFYAFPYWIAVSGTIFLVSAKDDLIMPVKDAEFISYFHELFQTTWKQASTLFTDRADFTPSPSRPPFSACVKTLPVSDSLGTGTSLSILRSQPYWGDFSDRCSLDRHLSRTLSEQHPFINRLPIQSENSDSFKLKICLFTFDGLYDFVKYGYLQEFSSYDPEPFSTQERVSLLKALYFNCEHETAFYRMVNTAAFHFPASLTLTLEEHICLSFNDLITTSQIMLDVFDNFFDYLIHSDLVLSKSETLNKINLLIDSLYSQLA